MLMAALSCPTTRLLLATSFSKQMFRVKRGLFGGDAAPVQPKPGSMSTLWRLAGSGGWLRPAVPGGKKGKK